MGDDFNPYEWHVGDPADWGDGIAGVPDIPYMGYLNDDEDDSSPQNPEVELARKYSDEAWRLENEGRFEEALVEINRAIDTYPHVANDFNRKAIILEDLRRHEEAIEFYRKALSISPADRVIRLNKSECILSLLTVKRACGELERYDLDLINEALKSLPDGEDNYAYLHIKGAIFEKNGRPAQARILYYLASKKFDEVDEAERQITELKNSNATYINIAATRFYSNFAPFHDDVVMDLIREDGNVHDRDAIRVEIAGKTVGYVANSPWTLNEYVKSASEIRSEKFTRAKFCFILLDSYVICKLI